MDVYGHMIPSKQHEAAVPMDELMSPIEVTNCTIFATRTNQKTLKMGISRVSARVIL
jgi:hypothetical protein